MASKTFDIRALETNDLTTKVNFSIEKLPEYKAKVIEEAEGSDEFWLTGPGPVWIYCALWHELHGRVPDGKLGMDAPGVGKFAPMALGAATGDDSNIGEGRVIIDVTKLETEKDGMGRLTFVLDRVSGYQTKALAFIPAFKVGKSLPEFEVMLTGPGPVWLYLALTAALHSRGGRVIYAAPNAPSVMIIDHK